MNWKRINRTDRRAKVRRWENIDKSINSLFERMALSFGESTNEAFFSSFIFHPSILDKKPSKKVIRI